VSEVFVRVFKITDNSSVSRAEPKNGNGALMALGNTQTRDKDLPQLSLHKENKNKGAC